MSCRKFISSIVVGKWIAAIAAFTFFPVLLSSSNESFSWDTEAHLLAARRLQKEGRVDELRREVRALKVLLPAGLETLALEARVLEAEMNWSEIIELTGAAAGESAETKLVRAKAFLALGKVERAQKILHALERSGIEGEAIYGEMLEARGDAAAVAASVDGPDYYRRALSLDPENIVLREKLAGSLNRAGKAKEAAEVMQSAAEAPGATETVRRAYVVYLEKSGDLVAVGRALKDWMGKSPGTQWLELSYANLLERMGSVEEAELLRARWRVAAQDPPQVGVPEKRRVIVVRKGDTLQSISDRIYGTTKRWTEIERANSDLTMSQKSLRPGIELRMPEVRPEGRQIASKSIVVSESVAPTASPEISAPVTAAEVVESEVQGPPRGSLSAAVGLTEIGNTLAGTGFQAQAKPEPGLSQQFAAAFSLTESLEADISLARNSSTYSSLSGLSPSSITARDESIQAGASVALSGSRISSAWGKNMELGLGWRLQRRNANATTPHVIVSAYQASGPTFVIASRGRIYGKLSGVARGTAFFATRYSEQNTNSGRFASAWGVGLELQALFPVYRKISALAGITYRRFKARFDGSGARGSIGAIETSEEWGLPMGIRWDF